MSKHTIETAVDIDTRTRQAFQQFNAAIRARAENT